MFEAQVDEAVDAVLVGEHEEEKDEKQVDEKKDEGSDATPPPAKKARLLEGLRIETRSVHRITGMTYDEAIGDEDQIESLELGWIERADTLGTRALRLPEANEGSEAVVEAAVEAVVEGAVEVVAEDRHASESVSAGEPVF